VSDRTNPNGWNSLESDDRFPDWKNWPGSVLLDDEIEHYCNDPDYKLIFPFDRKLLKPARYQLRLGSEARINGVRIAIYPDKPLVIPPHQVAIVRTLETLNIPRFLIARWNLRVDMVYKGLLWVGALQVDPGWVGYLPCPLYNMSDKPVYLGHGDKLFTIDFVRTTPFRKDKCRSYEADFEPNPALGIYDRGLRSGPYDALQKQDQLAKDIEEGKRRTDGLIATLFTAVGAVVAALSIVVARPVVNPDGRLLDGWPLTATTASVVALVLSIAAYRRSGRTKD
jgi:deoxycytidine triphosphate deaminase